MSPTAEQIGKLAHDALIQEALLAPKPGLVDAENNGAHKDMDLPLLILSADVLEPYFVRFTTRGIRDAALSPDGRLSYIRADGREAEAAMLAATNGVNTHKGALFLLGTLCYAAGYCAANGSQLRPETLCQTAARVCGGVSRELGASAGRAYARYGARGARGEAEDGLPHALLALNEYSLAKERGVLNEDGWRIALLRLIATLEDANVLARCGDAIALELRRRAGEIASRYPTGGEPLAHEMRALDLECQVWNASPGGAADLLACVLFLYRLSKDSDDFD